MSALSIGNEERAQIAALVKKAQEHPVTLEMLKRQMEKSPSLTCHTTRYSEFHIKLPVGFSVVLTIEHQPMGVCRHLSVSISRPGKLPHPAAVSMVMEEFGFQRQLSDCHFWSEEFDANCRSINVLEPINE